MKLPWLYNLYLAFVPGVAPVAHEASKGLTFKQLRAAQDQRTDEWDKQGLFDLTFHTIEMAGEAGEACNMIKKRLRHEKGLSRKPGYVPPSVKDVADELADVVIATDLVAHKLGIDLGEAVRSKFNETSAEHGFRTRA